MQPSMDADKNPCHNKNCSHLCILTKNGTSAMCGCSDGYSLSSKDGKTCKPDCKEPSKNVIVCGGSEPKCVNKRYVCDGILHCPDRLDEQNCPERVCPLGQFQCLDDPKNCLVESSAICDGTKQCKDGSDERFCSGKKT
uniref:EGF-like domain-containing protein n=1 Tax=Ditylenchus dipsaci TaxID=166011 RepID=A0A915DVK7_9BILA